MRPAMARQRTAIARIPDWWRDLWHDQFIISPATGTTLHAPRSLRTRVALPSASASAGIRLLVWQRTVGARFEPLAPLGSLRDG